MFKVNHSTSVIFEDLYGAVTENYTFTQNANPATEPSEFIQMKIAVLIDRLYVPLCVGVGVMGNFLCFVTLIFSGLRRTSTCVYMAALAVLDSIILLLDFCALLRGYLGHTAFYLGRDWPCGFHYFLFYFAIHFDVLLLLAMTFDRYVVVRFPFRAQRLCTPRTATVVIAATGSFSFVLNFQILFTRRLQPSGDARDPWKCWYPDHDVERFMTKIYTWIDAAIYSFVPFLALLAVNLLIILQLQESSRFSQQFTTRRRVPDGRSRGSRSETDGRASDSSVPTVDSEVNASYAPAAGENEGAALGVLATFTYSMTSTGSARSRGSSTANTRTASNASVTVMLLLVSFTFLVLTFPVAIALIYKRYYWLPSTDVEKAKARLMHAFVDNLMYTNHAVNFLLYCLSGRRFRLEFKRVLKRFLSCRRGTARQKKLKYDFCTSKF